MNLDDNKGTQIDVNAFRKGRKIGVRLHGSYQGHITKDYDAEVIEATEYKETTWEGKTYNPGVMATKLHMRRL